MARLLQKQGALLTSGAVLQGFHIDLMQYIALYCICAPLNARQGVLNHSSYFSLSLAGLLESRGRETVIDEDQNQPNKRKYCAYAHQAPRSKQMLPALVFTVPILCGNSLPAMSFQFVVLPQCALKRLRHHGVDLQCFPGGDDYSLHYQPSPILSLCPVCPTPLSFMCLRCEVLFHALKSAI